MTAANSTSETTTVLVLGANCFSGQDFVDLLLDNPAYCVIGVSRSPERSPLFLGYLRRADLSRYHYRQIDMNRDLPSLMELLDAERPAMIVNFTALSEVAPSWDHPGDYFETNCVALAGLVNQLRRRDYLRRFVQISSPEVYGTCVGRVLEDAPLNPSTPYAASKAAADLLLATYRKQFQFPVVTVRATNVYGAGQQLYKIIPRAAIYLLLGQTIELHGGGTAVKSYVHIRDVSRGELAVMEHGRIGGLYHLSPDAGISIRELVQRMCGLLKYDFQAATKIVAERPGQDAAYLIDSTRARQELGWRPQIGLDAGLSEVANWVRANLDAIRQLPLHYEHRL